MGQYALDSCFRGDDLTGLGNAVEADDVKDMKFTKGPAWWPYDVATFSKKPVKISKNKVLNTKYAITIMAQVYPVKPGIIFEYKNIRSTGVSLEITSSTLHFNLPLTTGKKIRTLIMPEKSLKMKQWNFVAASFSQDGTASLYVNGDKFEDEVGKGILPTDLPIEVGNFEGHMFCLQIHRVALNESDIEKSANSCPTGEWHFHVMFIYISN